MTIDQMIPRNIKYIFVGPDFREAAKKAASMNLGLSEWQFVFTQDYVIALRVFELAGA